MDCLYPLPDGRGSVIPSVEVTKRDPTQPAVVMPAKDAKTEQEPVYILQSTIISPTRRLALIVAIPADSLDKSGESLTNIINIALEKTKYVGIGEKIGDATITAIDKNSVILSWPGRKQTIHLFEHSGLEKHS